MSFWTVFISVLCVRSGRYVRQIFAVDSFSWFLLVPIPHMFLWLVSFSWFHIFSCLFPEAKLIRLDLLRRFFCWFLASWRARLGFVLVYTFYPPNCHLTSFLLPFVSFLSLCFFPPTNSSPAFPYFCLMFRLLFLLVRVRPLWYCRLVGFCSPVSWLTNFGLLLRFFGS